MSQAVPCSLQRIYHSLLNKKPAKTAEFDTPLPAPVPIYNHVSESGANPLAPCHGQGLASAALASNPFTCEICKCLTVRAPDVVSPVSFARRQILSDAPFQRNSQKTNN